MPYKKNYKQTDPKPILTNRSGAKANEYGAYEAKALGRIAFAAVAHGNAVYIQPSRFGTVTVKVYIEGDQFAENLNPGDDWGNLAEEIIEALWDREAVSAGRLIFDAPASVAESPAVPSVKGRPREATIP